MKCDPHGWVGTEDTRGQCIAISIDRSGHGSAGRTELVAKIDRNSSRLFGFDRTGPHLWKCVVSGQPVRPDMISHPSQLIVLIMWRGGL